MLRRAVGLAVVVSALAGASAAPALGATRFAVPAGGATSGDCTQTACTITYALSQAGSGDELSLSTGSYDLGSTLDITKKLSIVATIPTAPKPLLFFIGSSDLKLDAG